MNLKHLFIISVLLGSASVAYAKKGSRGGGGAVACMCAALAGESDGTEASMLAVGKTIMRRVQLGEGSICSVVHAPGQFVGVRRARSKSPDWRARACRVAQRVISQNLVHPYRQFRTTGYTRHRGKKMGGNTFFDTGGGRRAEVTPADDGRFQTASLREESPSRSVRASGSSYQPASVFDLFDDENGTR